MNHAMTAEKPCPFCKFVARSPQELGTQKLEVHRIRATPDGPEIVDPIVTCQGYGVKEISE